MPFETVTGYCWPQSITPGQDLALQIPSPNNTPVSVEIARVGANRTIVWSDTVTAADHAARRLAKGCEWPAVALLATDKHWQSGHYEMLLTIETNGQHRSRAVEGTAGYGCHSCSASHHESAIGGTECRPGCHLARPRYTHQSLRLIRPQDHTP